MKYRVAIQKKWDGAVFRSTPSFDSYEEADKRAKEMNEDYPDRHHWAEPAPEDRPIPRMRRGKSSEISVSAELSEEGKPMVERLFLVGEPIHSYRNADGTYIHESQFVNPADEFPVEIEPPE